MHACVSKVQETVKLNKFILLIASILEETEATWLPIRIDLRKYLIIEEKVSWKNQSNHPTSIPIQIFLNLISTNI
jgi:hypothetical protein